MFVGSIVDDRNEDPVFMDGAWVEKMDDGKKDGTSVLESNDICLTVVTIFEDNNDC